MYFWQTDVITFFPLLNLLFFLELVEAQALHSGTQIQSVLPTLLFSWPFKNWRCFFKWYSVHFLTMKLSLYIIDHKCNFATLNQILTSPSKSIVIVIAICKPVAKSIPVILSYLLHLKCSSFAILGTKQGVLLCICSFVNKQLNFY